MPAMPEWITRYGDTFAAKPDKPGVYRRKAGGFRIRGRVVNKASGRMLEINRALPDCRRASDALEILIREKAALRDRVEPGPTHATRSGPPLFAEYAVALYERKVRRGKAANESQRRVIASAKGAEKWSGVLEKHLIPAFGRLPVDQIRKRQVQEWLDTIPLGEPRKRERGKYSPVTVNTWLTILQTILWAAADEFEFARFSFADLKLPEPAPYTDEQPNTLHPDDADRFLVAFRRAYPQHYAMAALAIFTGLRPSSLRPLRRRGPNADIDWNTGVLLVRRSQTRGAEVMNSTKQGGTMSIALPPALVDILREHAALVERRATRRAERLAAAVSKAEASGDAGRAARLRAQHERAVRAAESELLFPTVDGGFRSASCLDKPFRAVSAAIGLPYRVTPGRGTRRTYANLARHAAIPDAVVRSISGHHTDEMALHYQHVYGGEQAAAIAKVIDIATARKAG